MMFKPEARKWVRIKFVFRGEYTSLRYVDGRGRRVIRDGKFFRTGELPFAGPCRIPRRIDGLLRQMLREGPATRSTAYGQRPVPLAVFIELDIPGVLHPLLIDRIGFRIDEVFRDLFKETLENVGGRAAYQVVFEGKPADFEPFRLPFNIAVAGSDASRLAGNIRDWRWYNGDPAVQDFGINLRERVVLDDGIDKDTDILIVSGPSGDRPAGTGKYFPRLAVFDDFWYYEGWRWDQLMRRGSSILLLPRFGQHPLNETFIKDFLYSIIHDFPLHEAFHFALERSGPDAEGACLFTTPAGNHALRIVDGLNAFQAEVAQYARTANPGNYAKFVERMPAKSRSRMRSAAPEQQHLSGYFNLINNFGDNFNQETSGLVPLAYEMKNFHNAVKPDLDRLKLNFSALVNDPAMFRELREAQNRVVDVTLDELNSSLMYKPAGAGTRMRPGEAYRLNVLIGQRSEVSLVTGQVDSVDPLLPDPDNEKGHELDIVVFPKDFRLSSPARQTVTLPLLGASDTARFLIVAPDGREKAELRIAVFSGNYLLQAFLLEARLEYSAGRDDGPMVQVRLDLANSAKFNNLEALQPRAMYIGLNGYGQGSHTLYIKNGTVVREVAGLNEALIEGAQVRFGELLKEAYFDDGLPRFPVGPVPAADQAEFDGVVRAYARMGAGLYQALFNRADETLKTALRQVARNSDLTFQIGRFDLNYSFPWALLYDLPLSEPAAGRPDYPVCTGEPIRPEDYPHAARPDQKGCRHNPGLYTYCTEGFWGVRHRLEQMLTAEVPADAVADFSSAASSRVMLVTNVDDAYCRTIAETLKQRYAATKVTPDCNLLDVLWDPATRPGALVVFGHLDTEELDGEPRGPRILTFPKDAWTAPGDIPGDKWLYDQLLHNKIIADDRWQGQPLPLVMLISCYNAMLNLSQLNSMVTEFYTARAAAVIGTECAITSDLGAYFIEEVMRGLYDEKLELGEAVQRFNRKMFAGHNPLAFVFTTYGNYNLKINT